MDLSPNTTLSPPRRPGRPRQGSHSGPKLAPGLAARIAATEVLAAVLVDHKPADGLIESSDGPFAHLDGRERALARAILGTALRRHGQIRAALRRFLDKALPKKSGRLASILEVAAAQILFMDVADHAAVSIAVESAAADRDARHFKGLANAVLRRLAEQRDDVLAGQDEARLNVPDWLYLSWQASYGAATGRQIALAHLSEPSLDLTVRDRPEHWARELGGEVLPTGSIRLVAHGPIETLPGFADGEWWVQDAAAALPARLLGPIEGKSVADLCAAPGGKTLQLAAAGAEVTAVDISESRMARVRRNLERLRLKATLVTADVAEWEPGRLFDAILLDAPCSATGTIRRHPDVALLKRPGDLAALVELQFRLLAKASSLLKPGGVLVYCTCSLEPQEGEDQIHRALAELPLALEPVAPRDVHGIEAICRNGFLRTLPSDLPAEDPRLAGLDGFFAARLRRI